MAIKIVAAVIAIVLVLAYLLPIVLKLKEVELGIVLLVGVALMLVDAWHSLKSRDS
jgi:hypothetical protein